MRLYHWTPAGPQIEADGFGVCLTIDQGRDKAWLSSDPNDRAFDGGGDWRVTVELPDDVAEAHRYRDDDGEIAGLYVMPFDVVNRYRPFTLECIPRPDGE